MDLRKFAQQNINWSRAAKYEGFRLQEYLDKIKNTTDTRLLSQLARAVPSFKGFGGKKLTGFQRKIISAAAMQRLRNLGHVGLEQPVKSSPT